MNGEIMSPLVGLARRPERMRLWLAGITAVVVAALWLGSAFELADERHRLIESARREAGSLAHSLSNDLRHSFRAIDVGMEHAGTIYLDQGLGDPAAIKPFLLDLREKISGIEDLGLADVDGSVLVSTIDGPVADIDLSDRDHFRAHLGRTDSALLISKPVVSRFTDKVILPVSKAVRGPDGELRAIVMASVGSQSFTRLYGRLDPGPRSAILLAHRDGVVIARAPETGVAGEDFSGRPLFSEHIKKAASGVFVSPRQSDGQVRITGYEVLPDLGLVLAVAIHKGELLADWRSSVFFHVAKNAALSLLVIGFGLFVWRAFEREGRLRQAADGARRLADERATRQQTVTALSQFAMEADRPQDVLDRAVRILRESLAADFASIIRRRRSDPQKIMVAGDGWQDGTIGARFELTPTATHVNYAIEAREPVVVYDFEHEDRFAPHPMLTTHGARSGIAAPFLNPQGDDGSVNVYSREPGAFSSEDARFVEAVAQVVAAFLHRLAESNLRDGVLDSMPAMIAVLEESGEIVMVNRFWREAADQHGLGLPNAGVGANYLDVCDRAAAGYGQQARDATEASRGLAGVLSGERDFFEMEYQCDAPTGEERRFQEIVAPVAMDIHRGAVTMHIDVTQRHMAERHLREAQRMEALGQLTGGIAHDFNNLLTVILGNIEILGDERPDDPAVRPIIEAVTEAAERGAGLTDQLLSYARQQRLEPRAIRPADVLGRVERLFRRTIRADIAFGIAIDPGCVDAVYADDTQLETALINLVLNAQDAMPDGGRIEIRCEKVEPEADAAEPHFIRFTVKDNGAGMSEETVNRAFEPFFTTKPVGQGTGLGLSMVHGFAIQSGGRVDIRSSPGQGAAVSLELPAVAAIAGSRTQRPHVATSADLPDRVALLVEDDPRVRGYLRIMLDRLGFETHEAENGEDAVRMLGALPKLDVVISDVIMPGTVSGYGLSAEVRQVRPEVPVILMSGYSDPAVMENLRNFDAATLLLRKPFTRAQLIEALNQAFERET